MEQFWMLYMEGARAPACKHATRQVAEQEAARLLKEHGKPVFLLLALGRYSTGEPKWEKLAEADPFSLTSSTPGTTFPVSKGGIHGST